MGSSPVRIVTSHKSEVKGTTSIKEKVKGKEKKKPTRGVERAGIEAERVIAATRPVHKRSLEVENVALSPM
jgi:hypothetical protein